MSERYYFQHDYNPTSDPKIVCLLGDHGGLGYGIFWRIVELLHQEDGNKLKDKPYIYQAIAKQMLTSAEQVQAVVEDCVTKYELFEKDGTHFWSVRVNRNMEKREEISRKRSEAGKIGQKVKQANAKQNLANVSKAKERK